MIQAFFDFHGIEVCISCSPTDSIALKALNFLTEDFHFFRAQNSKAKVRLLLIGESSPLQIGKFELFKTRMCKVFGLGRERICDYGHGSHVQSFCGRREERTLKVFSSGPNELYEFAYIALLSAVGEALDHLKFHRVHALGFSHSGSATLLLLPSGGGKSTLATKLLNSGRSPRLLSDESPLIKKGIVYPFPNHIALASNLVSTASKNVRVFERKYFPNKTVFQVPREQVGAPSPLKTIFIGRRQPGKVRITQLSKWNAFYALFKAIVIGDGLVQMAEFMLRANNIFGLVKIAFSRLFEVMHIVRHVPCYEFVLGDDLEENFQALISYGVGPSNFLPNDVRRRPVSVDRISSVPPTHHSI